MIVHLVFFRFKESANGHSAQENRARAERMLRALPDRIPEIREFKVGSDISGSPASFDLGLYSVFDSSEDLKTYGAHPDHQKVVDFFREVVSERAVVDFEV